MCPLASETILSAKAVSLKRQGNEREKKARYYLICVDPILAVYKISVFQKQKKLEKAFVLCCWRCHSSLPPLLKEE